MPRPGPRRPLVALKLSEAGIEHVDRRATEEADGNRSEMLRRMIAYASIHMPRNWKPKSSGGASR